MVVEPVIFISFIVVVIMLGFISIALAYFYLKTISKIELIKNKNAQIKTKIDEKAEKALEVAREKAVKIIQEAAVKTEDLLSKTEEFSQDSKSILKSKLAESAKRQSDALNEATKLLLLEYRNELSGLKNDNINLAKNISKGIEKDILLEIKDFKDVMRQETISSQKIVGEKMEQEYEAAKKEVVEYKEAELKKVDENIKKILTSVSAQVLGEALTMEEHEDLVMKALDKAKADFIKLN